MSCAAQPSLLVTLRLDKMRVAGTPAVGRVVEGWRAAGDRWQSPLHPHLPPQLRPSRVVNNRCHSYYLAHRRPGPASADFHPAHTQRRTPQPRHPVGLRLNIQFLIRCPQAKAGLRKLGTVGHRPRRDVATVARGLPDGGFYLEGVLDIPHHFDAFLISSSRRGGETTASSSTETGRPAGAVPRTATGRRMPSLTSLKSPRGGSLPGPRRERRRAGWPVIVGVVPLVVNTTGRYHRAFVAGP
ncbi:hypothetical protein E2C01_041057 [Portunus trituberculatus]|uniref:Uncharacterized protein n=1 Tax=Portunus trituberculatus TaxID=210409 RepID=A0A5B7FPD4_PORTR|nr:hypothetical protein [Portunus trituberculatus]